MERIELQAKSDRELLLLTVDGVNNINKRLDKMNGIVNEHDERIRVLENWRNIVIGGLGVITAIVIPVALRLLV